MIYIVKVCERIGIQDPVYVPLQIFLSPHPSPRTSVIWLHLLAQHRRLSQPPLECVQGFNKDTTNPLQRLMGGGPVCQI